MCTIFPQLLMCFLTVCPIETHAIFPFNFLNAVINWSKNK